MADEMKRWKVRDSESRELAFTGVQLAEATSARTGKSRWIELRLYRTAAGAYVVERLGRSTVEGERTFYFAQVCDTAEAVIETLYAKDEDGAWFLSNVARRLLEAAGALEPAIQRVYATEHVA